MKLAIVIALFVAALFALCLAILSSVTGSRGDNKEALVELGVAIGCTTVALLLLV